MIYHTISIIKGEKCDHLDFIKKMNICPMTPCQNVKKGDTIEIQNIRKAVFDLIILKFEQFEKEQSDLGVQICLCENWLSRYVCAKT